QIATASASQASSDSIGSGSRRIDRIISCTWLFSARPYPTTLVLTSIGEYSPSPIPASAMASSATPRTCASLSALLTFAEKKMPSTAAEIGRASCREREVIEDGDVFLKK